jgi:hypothetical protein
MKIIPTEGPDLHVCDWVPCGNLFEPRREDQRFCSDRCRRLLMSLARDPDPIEHLGEATDS